MTGFYAIGEVATGSIGDPGTSTPVPGDTTAPTLTAASATATGSTTATGSVTTNEAGGTLYATATSSATATATQVQAGASKVVTAAGAQSVAFTGLPSATTLYPHYVHVDAAGNVSAVANGASFTTAAPADTTGPVMQGAPTATKTSTTIDLAWSAATDASGIGEYFVSKDGGAAVSTGTSRSKSFTGLAPLSTHLYEITAADTLGNLSSNSLIVTVTTDAAGDDPVLADKTIVVTLKAHDLNLQANVGGIYWTWSDARGTVTSSGSGLAASAAGVLSIPIRTALMSDGVGFLTLDNYNGGNPLTYFGFAGPVRVP